MELLRVVCVDKLSQRREKVSVGCDLLTCVVGISALGVFNSEGLLESEEFILHYLVNGLLTNQCSRMFTKHFLYSFIKSSVKLGDYSGRIYFTMSLVFGKLNELLQYPLI